MSVAASIIPAIAFYLLLAYSVLNILADTDMRWRMRPIKNRKAIIVLATSVMGFCMLLGIKVSGSVFSITPVVASALAIRRRVHDMKSGV